MKEQNNSLAETLAALIKPIVEESVKEALNGYKGVQPRGADTSYFTTKQAAEFSSLAPSTIRLLIRRRRLKALRVGRRVLIKRNDLERLLEAHPIEAQTD